MLTEASAIGGRTARACDGCMLRRASWFCASDDAFLCHACDASVHSANQLVSRHERVRISTAEASKPGPIELFSVADWHQKVTRRARTPRNGVKAKAEVSSSVVPEIGVEEELICENGDLLVFQVPVFDADCCFWNEDESASVEELHSLLDFVPDDIQFSGGDEEGLFMCEDGELEMLGFKDSIKKSSRVKREEDDVIGRQFDTGVRTLGDWDFGLESDEMAVKEEEEEEGYGKRRMLLLKLNCEEVVSAWDEHGCPWMNGARPELDALGDGWVSIEFLQGIRETNGGGEEENGGRSLVVSEERIARVRRYREKRRRRLFSKKIRYEVRKVNAEKRPRMKGRFCKRVQSYVGPQVTSLK